MCATFNKIYILMDTSLSVFNKPKKNSLDITQNK
jgi:hypothetical protein